MEKAPLAAGSVLLVGIAVLGGAVGAISVGATGLVIAGGLHLLGFVALGTAKLIFAGIAAVGAIIGAVVIPFWVMSVATVMAE